LEISFSFQWLKNFENPLRFDEVTAMSLVVPFYVDTVYICLSPDRCARARVCLAVPAYFKFRVEGEGIMSSIYRGLVAVFDPMSKSDVLSTFADCIPRPRQPNFYMYRVMGLRPSASDSSSSS